MTAESTDPTVWDLPQREWAAAWPKYVAAKMKPYADEALARYEAMLAARDGRGMLGAGPDEDVEQ